MSAISQKNVCWSLLDGIGTLGGVDDARKLIETKMLEKETGFIGGYMPRWVPDTYKGPSFDLSATARYAHALIKYGKQGDATATKRGEELVAAILKYASTENGLIDYLGRKLPVESVALGQADGHAYLCLKAAIGWEILGTFGGD